MSDHEGDDNDDGDSGRTDDTKRSIIVADIPTGFDAEMVLLWMENKRNGGGDVDKFEFNKEAKSALVVFQDEKVASHLLEAGKLSMGNCTMRVLPPTDDHVLYVTDISEENVDFIESFVSNVKKGGGPIVEYQYDDPTKSAFVKFVDVNVAKRLLEKSFMEIAQKRVNFSKYPPESTPELDPNDVSLPPSDGEDNKNEDIDVKIPDPYVELLTRTICVSGVPESFLDILEVFLENAKKGGGPIEAFKNDVQDEVIVTFQDLGVAQHFVETGYVELGKSKYEVKPAQRKHVCPSAFPDVHSFEEHEDQDESENFNDHSPRGAKNGNLKKFDGEKDVSSESDSDSSEVSSSTVEVRNIRPGEQRDNILMFLENKKRSGGGKIVDMQLDSDAGTAVVHYEKEEVAQGLIEKGSITMTGGHILEVKPYRKTPVKKLKLNTSSCASKRSPNKSKDSESPVKQKTNHRDSKESEHRESRTIEVTGLTKAVLTENLELYFENKKKSGGGSFQSFNRLSPESAVIVFKDSADARRVAEKSDHNYLDANMSITLLDSWPDVPSCAIKVTGFSAKTSRETISLFFASRKVSNGVEPEEVLYDAQTCTAIVTYESSEVSQSVADKEGLKLEEKSVRVELMAPARPPPLLVTDDIDPDTLLFTEMTELFGGTIDTNQLKDFASSAGKCTVSRVTYTTKLGTALVYYKGQPDYEHARRMVCSKPFQGKMISIQRVPLPKSIQVHNVKGLTKDNLELYFENSRSGGGDVRKSRILGGDQPYAIIEFVDRSLISRVVSKTHVISGQSVKVQPYLECLGVNPPGFDSSTPFQPKPEDVELESVPEVVDYILQTPKTKAKIEQDLKKMHCHIAWPKKGAKENIVLSCTVSMTSPDAYESTKDWGMRCETFARGELGKFLCRKVEVLQVIWKDFEPRITQKWSQSSDEKASLLMNLDKKGGVVFISGLNAAVLERVRELTAIKEELDEKLRISKLKITELVNAKPHQIELLKLSPDILKSAHDVDIKATEKGFELHGQSEAVKEEKLAILKRIASGISEKYLERTSEGLSNLLSKATVKDRILGSFSRASIVATYVVQGKDVKVYTLSQTHENKAVELLKSEIKEKVFQLDEAIKDCLLSSKGKNFLAELDRKFKYFEQTTDKSTWTISAVKDEYDQIVPLVEEFFDKNAIKDTFVALKSGVVEVLEKYCPGDIDKIRRELRDMNVELTLARERNGKAGCSVRGNVAGVKRAEEELRRITNQIKTQDYKVEHSMIRFLRKPQSRNTVSGIANNHKAVIRYSDEDDESSEGGKAGKNADLAHPRVHTHVTMAGNTSQSIKLVVGDITKHPVDAMINAANERLDHVGGVAHAILVAGGNEIQSECDKRVSTKGPLSPGTIFKSTPGRLPCKAIIHTVGPIWKGGHNHEERDLKDAVYQALKEADYNGYKTVSMPFISCGIYHFPKDKGSQIILRTVVEYFKDTRSSSINEVHIVSKEEVAKLFCSEMKSAYFASDLKPVPLPRGMNRNGSVEDDGERRGESNRETDHNNDAEYSRGSTRSSGAQSNGFKTNEGVSVSLIKGSIAAQKVDVIVCTSGRDLDLSKGAISKSLLSAAGSGLQDQLRADYPSGLHGGQIGHTGGYNLQCHEVYHAVVSRWDPSSGESLLRNIVRESLSMASKKRHQSIAFPTIGCGRLHYPVDLVARATFEEIERFSSQQRDTTVQDVRIVVYNGDEQTIAAFERELRNKSGGSGSRMEDRRGGGGEGGGSGSSHGHRSSDDYRSGDRSSSQRGSYDTRSSHGKSSASSEEIESIDISIGDVKFIVKLGNITKEKCDAIVNSTNDRLSMSFGALSKAIVAVGGKSIADECSAIGKVDSHGMAVTGAGRLPCKNIYHLTARDTNGWKSVIENCLKEADKKGVTCIGLPPLGTGRKDASVRDCAEALYSAVRKFSDSKPSNLVKITVVIMDKSMLAEFVEAVEKEGKTSGNPIRKLVSKIKDAFMDFGKDGDNNSERSSHNDSKQYKPWNSTGGRNGGYKPVEHNQTKSYSALSSGLVLYIYAMEERNIQKVLDDIKKMNQVKRLDDEKIKKFVERLTPAQEQRVRDLERDHHVSIDIVKNPLDRSLTLKGDPAGISEALVVIYGMLVDTQSHESEQRELENLGKSALWEWSDGAKYHAFDNVTRGKIEKANIERKPTVEWKQRGMTYRITFKDNKEEILEEPGKSFAIRKFIPGNIELPRRWVPVPKDKTFLTVQIQPTDEEYKKVITHLAQPQLGIQKIERIQNPTLYRQYKSCKKDMDNTNGGSSNETRVWHGTAGVNVVNINSRNFNRSYCGQHGVAIGNGVYFATNAQYSIGGYCPPDAGTGLKYLYQARVLTGKTVRGAGGMKEPPNLPGRTDATYDSVSDNPAAPGMYVVFKDPQAYPEYLITFK